MKIPINIVINILKSVTFDHEGKPLSSLPAGTIAYTEGEAESVIVGLIYVCPCGCQGIGALPFYKYDNHDPWQWNGSIDKPTLTPSILRSKTCQWHGFLTDGIFV